MAEPSDKKGGRKVHYLREREGVVESYNDALVW